MGRRVSNVDENIELVKQLLYVPKLVVMYEIQRADNWSNFFVSCSCSGTHLRHVFNYGEEKYVNTGVNHYIILEMFL
jgi:hypothetical protein